MKKTYIPNVGETAKIITSKIETNLNGKTHRSKEKHRRIEKIKSGKFEKSDLKYLIAGCDFLRIVGNSAINGMTEYITSSDKQLNSRTIKAMAALKICQGPIFEFLSRYRNHIQAEYNLQREIANLENLYEIIDKSRDGIITRKQEIEDRKGEKIEIEVTMSEKEVANTVKDYINQLYRVQDKAFVNYLGLGMSIVSMVGALINESKNSKEMTKKIGISGLISIGTFFGRRYFTKDYGKKVGEEARKIRRGTEELIENEPVSKLEEAEKIRDIKEHTHKMYKEDYKIERRVSNMRGIEILSTTFLAGMIGMENLEKADKFDAKTISQIIVEISQKNYLIGDLVHNVDKIFELYHEKSRLAEYEKQLENIVKQIEEKQDPLLEADQPFESLEIKNFKGNFYQNKDTKTGKMKYRHKIEIPEFSIKKGEIVLLSGKSGIGKSTFLRLLKRGDIHNRGAIRIDQNQVVDKLGKQFIAIKANRDLGTYSNVLKELIGKETISNLEEEEMQRLQTVLQEVCLDREGILEELETKDYSQFSTGQKKRLVLAQMLYRTLERPSIILVDEAVGNVENELIDSQLKAITQVIRNINAMGIIVTHRVDLARRYVDKHYHIGEDGIMREMKQSEQEKDI